MSMGKIMISADIVIKYKIYYAHSVKIHIFDLLNSPSWATAPSMIRGEGRIHMISVGWSH